MIGEIQHAPRRRRTAWLLAGAAVCLMVSMASPSRAHDFAVMDVLVVLKADGTWLADVTVDVDALALGADRSAPSSELAAALGAMSPAELAVAAAEAEETLRRRLRVRFDGVPVDPQIAFPHLESPEPSPTEPTVLGTLARLSGPLPDGAREVTFSASRAFGPVQLTVLEQATATGSRQVLVPGEESAPHVIGALPGASQPGWVAGRYLLLGFEHILPKGLDHILFVLGLFLLSARLKPLVWQITAFTVAHSVTLALSIYGIVSLPSHIVETLIALSIVYVAAENWVTSELKPWRPLLVFGFGLLHGLGFAGVLRDLGLPREEFVTALITFNVGVELGQLAVVLGAFAAVGWARDRPWYRPAVVRPVSALIAIIGLYWAIERAGWWPS